MHSDFVDTIRELAVAFEREGLDWAIAGAVAANLYRDQVRSTSDLDVVVALVGSGTRGGDGYFETARMDFDQCCR